MAQAFDIRVKNDRRIQKALTALPEGIRRRVLKKAINEVTKRIRKDMRSHAPESTGNGLKRVIKTKPAKISKQVKTNVYGNVGATGKEMAPLFVENPKKSKPQPWAKIANVIEYGWQGQIDPYRHGGDRPPEPFIRPAAKRAERYAAQELRKAIGNKINKEAARLAKKR